MSVPFSVLSDGMKKALSNKLALMIEHCGLILFGALAMVLVIIGLWIVLLSCDKISNQLKFD